MNTLDKQITSKKTALEAYKRTLTGKIPSRYQSAKISRLEREIILLEIDKADEERDEQLKPTTDAEIKHRLFEVHEFIEYLRYIAKEDAGYQLTAGQVWNMFELGVRDGMHWSEVAENVGLPQNLDWY